MAIETRDSQSRQLRYSSGCSAYFSACFALDGSSLSQTLSLKARSTLEPFSGSVSFSLLFCGSVLPLSSSASDAEEGPRGRRWWEQNGRAGRKPFVIRVLHWGALLTIAVIENLSNAVLGPLQHDATAFHSMAAQNAIEAIAFLV